MHECCRPLPVQANVESATANAAREAARADAVARAAKMMGPAAVQSQELDRLKVRSKCCWDSEGGGQQKHCTIAHVFLNLTHGCLCSSSTSRRRFFSRCYLCVWLFPLHLA